MLENFIDRTIWKDLIISLVLGFLFSFAWPIADFLVLFSYILFFVIILITIKSKKIPGRLVSTSKYWALGNFFFFMAIYLSSQPAFFSFVDPFLNILIYLLMRSLQKLGGEVFILSKHKLLVLLSISVLVILLIHATPLFINMIKILNDPNERYNRIGI